jgi:hypothetical protein
VKIIRADTIEVHVHRFVRPGHVTFRIDSADPVCEAVC